MYHTLTSDQFTMTYGIVVPGTLRDSLLEPKEVMTDTAGHSDLVFGLFRLLGFGFSPRIKDVGSSRYWRTDCHADYGKLNDVARSKIDLALIAKHWDDVLRVVGLLRLNAVNAAEVMRVLARDGSLSSLGKAIAEIGRAAGMMYLLEYFSNETYREYVSVLHEYRKFLFLDPGLPLVLQPKGFLALEAAGLFRSRKAQLAPLVNAYVERTFEVLPV